jgi:hypothetical protein
MRPIDHDGKFNAASAKHPSLDPLDRQSMGQFDS